MPQFTYNLRSISNGDNGQFQDLVSSGQVVSNKPGAASSSTQGPNRFAGGLAVNNTSVMNKTQVLSAFSSQIRNPVGRNTTTGAGYIPTAAGSITLATTMFLPSTGTTVRTGATAAPTDTLPTTSSIITAVSAEMPGGVWQVGVMYNLLWVNSQTDASYTWTITRGDTSTIINGNTSTTTLAILASSSSFNRFSFIRVMRLSATVIAIWNQ